VDVLLAWNPAIIRFFLDNGADVVTGSPFALAFRERIRTALGPYLECKRSHPELADKLQEQADRALRHFCYKGDIKWVSLLMWAGADPRTPGPEIDEEDDPESYTTGLRNACYGGNLEVLKRIKPDRGRDDLAQLVNYAAVLTKSEAVRYLLGCGANPNSKDNGGSPGLDRCLSDLAFRSFDPWSRNRPKSLYDIRRTVECLKALIEHGALWRPDDRKALNDVRRALC